MFSNAQHVTRARHEKSQNRKIAKQGHVE
jgi:hypothetical protein